MKLKLSLVYDEDFVMFIFVLTFILACSGYGIAAQALTAVIRAHDGRGPLTTLTNSILDTLNLSSPDELIGYASNAYSII